MRSAAASHLPPFPMASRGIVARRWNSVLRFQLIPFAKRDFPFSIVPGRAPLTIGGCGEAPEIGRVRLEFLAVAAEPCSRFDVPKRDAKRIVKRHGPTIRRKSKRSERGLFREKSELGFAGFGIDQIKVSGQSSRTDPAPVGTVFQLPCLVPIRQFPIPANESRMLRFGVPLGHGRSIRERRRRQKKRADAKCKHKGRVFDGNP